MNDPINGPTSDRASHAELPPDDEDRRARLRAHRNAARRALRAARREAGRCVECDRPRDADGPTTNAQYCAACARRYRAYKQHTRKQPRLIAPDSPENIPPASDGPACSHCGSGAIIKQGRGKGRQRYSCKVCGKYSLGVPLASPPDLPCPYCKAQCTKAGRARSGRQMYRCRACGRWNTELRPAEPRSPGGPFRRVKTFNLNPAAARRLTEYCNATGMSVAQAMRAIFREAAHAEGTPGGPLVLASGRRDGRGARTEWGDREAARLAAGTAERLNLHVRLPDLRAETARARMKRTGAAKYAPTVLVAMRMRLCMDDAAWEGLLRTMKRHDDTHQAAARRLVMGVRLPEQVRFAVATGGRRR